MGKLRGAVARIESISYVDDHGQDFAHGGDFTMLGGYAAFDAMVAPAFTGYRQDVGVRPARPVTVKIVCDETVQQKVVSKLVNLHAYRIVAT